jgi:hypothetical protein
MGGVTVGGLVVLLLVGLVVVAVVVVVVVVVVLGGVLGEREGEGVWESRGMVGMIVIMIMG